MSAHQAGRETRCCPNVTKERASMSGKATVPTRETAARDCGLRLGRRGFRCEGQELAYRRPGQRNRARLSGWRGLGDGGG